MKVRAIMDRGVRIHSKDLIETLRKRIVELEDLERYPSALNRLWILESALI